MCSLCYSLLQLDPIATHVLAPLHLAQKFGLETCHLTLHLALMCLTHGIQCGQGCLVFVHRDTVNN